MIAYASTKFATDNANLKIYCARMIAETVFFSCCFRVMITVCILTSISFATMADSLRYRSGVRNSQDKHRLRPQQLSKLLENLRHKSGFLEMHFDENEFLHLGDRSKIEGGSALARALLIAAVDRERAIDLECHNRSSMVAFARLASPIDFTNRTSGARITVYPIEIDFNDFDHLRGDKAVIEAFDLGYVVLHELGHAALGLTDAMLNGQEPGECEEYINGIRRELGTPERQSYVARTFISRAFASQAPLRKAELIFARTSGKSKNQILNLSWEAERVGEVKKTVARPHTNSPRSHSLIAP